MLTCTSKDARRTVSCTGTESLAQHTVPQKPRKRCFKGPVLALAAALAAGYVVFGAATALAQESGDYPDVASDSYYTAAVQELSEKGVFTGTECDEGFCPDDPIDRATMAVWTVRILDGADPLPVTSTRFADVDAAHRYAAFIERFAELGVTRGCGDGTEFCPDDTVTRAEMAVFLTRALDLDEGPDPGFDDGFDDVPSYTWYASEVASLAASGITRGCGDGSGFCPGRATARAQMAAFLYRAINRSLDHLGGPLITIESTAPLVTRTAFQITLRFSEPVSGLSLSDLMVVNGRAANLTGSGERYTARIEPLADGIVMVRLPVGTVAAGDGSPNQASAPLIRTIAAAARLDAPGFDTWNRGLVFQSMHVELLRRQPAWGYTGDVIRCVAGTTSQEFRDSVIQRINWYRQMAGLGTVTEDPDLSASAQQAALIMAAHGELSHYPDSDWTCFNGEGAASAGRSNLYLGRAGTSGIDGYIRDHGANNISVGHRRWILNPATLEMGTGDIGYPYRANALDVTGGDRLRSRPDVREERGFVSWPPSGYVPPGVVWGRWSFSLAGADFRESSVAVTDDSGQVQVELLVRSTGYIVWAVAGDTNSNLLPAPSNGDQCYAVAVSGVKIDGRTATPFEYPVCVIDPEAPGNPPVPLIDETYAGRPSVTVSSAAPSEVNAAFMVTISFSEPVVVPEQSSRHNRDLTGIVYVENGTVSNISCVYTVEILECYARIVPREQGSVVVGVDAGVVHDRDGEPNLASDLLSRESAVSTTGPPTVSLSSSAPPVVTDSFEVTVTFSEPVTVTVQEDSLYSDLADLVSVANGTVPNISCGLEDAILVCKATILPDDHGSVVVSVEAGAVQDGDGQPNRASERLTRESAISPAGPPTVSLSSSAPPVVTDSFEVVTTFSEPVTGMSSWCEGPPSMDECLQVVNGTIEDVNCDYIDFTAEFLTCTVTILPDSIGEVIISVNPGTVRDRDGNANTDPVSLTRESRISRPTVVISSDAPQVVTGSFNIRITFSEAVSGFEQDDIQAINGTVTRFSGSGSEYTATVIVEIERADLPLVIVLIAGEVAHDRLNRPNLASEVFRRFHTDPNRN